MDFNIKNLPKDLIFEICYLLDTKTLQNLVLAQEWTDWLPTQFWIDYFNLHDIKIITKQDNVISWVNEFKVAEIMTVWNNFTYKHGHTFRKPLGPDPIHNEAFQFECTHIDIDYPLKIFGRPEYYNIHKVLVPTIIINKYFITFKINKEEYVMRILDQIILYKYLFALFDDKIIINYSNNLKLL